MHLPKNNILASSRNALKSSASLLTLAVGSVGWSGLAYAAGEETASQVLLLPEHYELMDNGVVVFKLETGENLSLTSDQYLILDDGLLLITDELAQASVYSLPVMGSIRAQLLSDLTPVATIDGTVAEATPSQTLSITQGTAPRLSEQVDLQSYELAQASDGSSSEVGEAVAVGLSVSPGAMALLALFSNSSEEAIEPAIIAVPWDPNASPGVMPQPLDNYISFDFANSIAPVTSVKLTGAQGLALSPATSSGILTWSNAVQNSGTTSWTAQTSLIRVQALNANGDTTVETVRLVGQLILGDDDVASGVDSVSITGSDGDD